MAIPVRRDRVAGGLFKGIAMTVDRAEEAGPMIPAQTNGALLQQMHDAGNPTDALRRIQRVYNECLELFLGQHRGSGRPFVCHLVGTASIVAQAGGSTDMIVAALCHSLFGYAVFRDGRTIYAPKNRNRIKEAIGADAFELVRQYDKFQWSNDAIAEMASRAAPGDDLTRSLWVIRLANEIDDMSNCSMALAPKHGPLQDRLANCAVMARKIGEERLALTLDHLAAQYERQRVWTKDLEMGPPASFRLVPNAYNYLRTRRVRPCNLRIV